MQNQKCFNVSTIRKIKRLSEEQIKRMEKRKAKMDEGLHEDEAQYQSKGYLPMYLKKVEAGNNYQRTCGNSFR